MKVLIAGGAGFIGSTIASACIDTGITPVILDNLATGRREFTDRHTFYEGDICDGALVDRIFEEHPGIDTVIDCAALIVVPDSVANPLGYYRENVSKGIEFLEHLARNNCRNLLFSSSASLYRADPEDFSVDEGSPLEPLSPYARTKSLIETAPSAR
ncbi:NAD-dependent epimerase/dehydratase family protein [Streptomyces sp. NPDC006487]|uniref:NAD-dependent epimerase/dehydratase family protein n=1 Tax=Streptomyces sp. NPDC006487 TaxID=3364748 RepID=UPI0036CB23A6